MDFAIRYMLNLTLLYRLLDSNKKVYFHVSLGGKFPLEYTHGLFWRGPGVAYWLRRYATSRKVPGSIPSRVTGDFFRSI
jgi:hypothetical protein